MDYAKEALISLEKIDKSERIKKWAETKENLSHEFIEDKEKVKARTINIGDVFDCEVGENIGDEQCDSRPVLVVSKSMFNKNSLVTVVPLSTTISTRMKKINGKTKRVLKTRTHYILMKKHFSFLSEDSVAKCEQIKCISKSRLKGKRGSVDQSTLNKIKIRLSDLLDLN